MAALRQAANIQACLRDAHPSGHAEEKRRGSLISCFRPRRHSKLASEEELDKAAQYVVARFGAYDNGDEEEEEGGAEELDGQVGLATEYALNTLATASVLQTKAVHII